MATHPLFARLVQVGLAVLAALVAIVLYEMRHSFAMLSASARPVLPPFWVRPQPSAMGSVSCRNVRGAYVPDPRAYSIDPATGKHAQTTDSCEDVQMSKELGLAVFSCDPGRYQWNAVMGPLEEPHKRGALWVLDYKDPNAEPQYLPIHGFPDTHDFHPLGMSIYDASPKLGRLFVVNHRELANTIEVIDLQKEDRWRARYIRTLYHPVGTHAANSLFALDRNEVLVTNMHTSNARMPPKSFTERTVSRLYGGWARRFVPYLFDIRFQSGIQSTEDALGGGWVAHLTFTDHATMPPHEELAGWEQGIAAHAVAHRIPFANGLSVTPSHRHVVVASTTGPGVFVHPVQRFTAEGDADWHDPAVLGTRVWIPTPFLADNLEVIPPKPGRRILADDPLLGASIVVAGHPSVPDLAEHIQSRGANVSQRGPSWAVEIRYTGTHQLDTAPLPAHTRMPSLPRGWSAQTLVQTDGSAPLIDGKRVELPSSCGVVWDNTGEGLGTLILSGLYSPAPLVCQGVYL